MTMPPSMLSRVEYKLIALCNVLEGDEDRPSIADRLEEIELQLNECLANQRKIEDIGSLIVKLLGKDNL